MQAVDVTSQLFNTVNFATPFDFHSNRLTVRIATQQVNWPNRSGVFTANQREAWFDAFGQFGKQHLQVRFNAVFGQARVFAEFVTEIRMHFV